VAEIAPLDGPVPPLRAVYLYPTGDCNQRCRHCWVEAPPPTAPRTGAPIGAVDLARLVTSARAVGLEWVKVTGGEPFVRSDTIEIIAALRAEGLAVEVETNGTLIDDALARALARAGVRQVSVSLDGAAATTHDAMRGQRGAHARAERAIRRLVERGVPAQVLFTLCRANAPEVDALLDRCAELGVDSFKLNFLAPMGRGAELHRSGEALPVGQVLEVVRHVEERRAPRLPFPVATSVPLAFASRARLRLGEGHVCPIRSILGVLADGRAALCGVGYLAPELVVGDARRESLAAIWRGSPLLRDLRGRLHARLRGVCGRCLMRGACLGSCRASAYLQGGDLYAPFWFCEEAERVGLFPAERLETA
jgi:SynChlorMet cassette radical SAM/SPASM protein ScmF